MRKALRHNYKSELNEGLFLAPFQLRVDLVRSNSPSGVFRFSELTILLGF